MMARTSASSFARSRDARFSGRLVGRPVVLSVATPGATGPLEATAVTDVGRFVLPDPTPDPLEPVQRAIMEEFVRTVSGGLVQPLDVHRGVRLQRLIAAVLQSLQTEDAVLL